MFLLYFWFICCLFAFSVELLELLISFTRIYTYLYYDFLFIFLVSMGSSECSLTSSPDLLPVNAVERSDDPFVGDKRTTAHHRTVP